MLDQATTITHLYKFSYIPYIKEVVIFYYQYFYYPCLLTRDNSPFPNFFFLLTLTVQTLLFEQSYVLSRITSLSHANHI